jgi:hypothetical protein
MLLQTLLASCCVDRHQDEWYIEFRERFQRYIYDIQYGIHMYVERASARATETGTLNSWSVSRGIFIIYNIGYTHTSHTHTHTHTFMMYITCNI